MNPENIGQAIRDWRSGRAFMQNGVYRLKPIALVCGVPTIVSGRSTRAPWSEDAIAWFGSTSERLHRAAFEIFPKPEQTPFERLHNLDRIASEILREDAQL